MNIIYLHQYFKFPDETGGTRSYDLALSFVKKGNDVIVVTATSDPKYKTKQRWTVIEREGIKVHYIYLPYGNDLSYQQRSIVFFKFLWYSVLRLIKLKGDVVLATSTPLTIGIPALVNKWIKKTPFVFEVRDVWPEAVIAIGAIKAKWMQRILYGMEKLIYKNSSAIVPLSIDMRRSIINRYPEFTEKASTVIENIAEINRFQNVSDVVNIRDIIGFIPRFTVFYAGTFGKVNGVHKMIELASETLCIDKDLVYVLIGSGAEKNNVIKLAKSKSVLNKNVFILDSISKNELPNWYGAVSIGSSFVIDIPELWANSANKFFDTLAAGRPILINHEGWQAETIRNRNIGYVLPFQITQAAAMEFVNYTKDETLAQEQKRLALKLAKEEYSLEVASERYLQIFKQI